jgi:hypothetical protein
LIWRAWVHHVIVTTATASGKSLCYNAPVLETLLLDGEARALYLFRPRRSRRISGASWRRWACSPMW